MYPDIFVPDTKLTSAAVTAQNIPGKRPSSLFSAYGNDE